MIFNDKYVSSTYVYTYIKSYSMGGIIYYYKFTYSRDPVQIQLTRELIKKAYKRDYINFYATFCCGHLIDNSIPITECISERKKQKMKKRYFN